MAATLTQMMNMAFIGLKGNFDRQQLLSVTIGSHRQKKTIMEKRMIVMNIGLVWMMEVLMKTAVLAPTTPPEFGKGRPQLTVKKVS